MEKVSTVINKLKSIDGFASGDGVGISLISLAEERLGLKFSPQFRFFLQSYGWIEIPGYEILGLINGDFTSLDVVGATESFRYYNGYSDDLLIICNLDEESVAFDYSDVNNEGEPKIIYNTISDKVEDAAEDFVGYLETLYDEAF